MNETLLTVSLLTIVVCNLGVLYLCFRVFRGQDSLYGLLKLVLSRLSEAANRQRHIKQDLLADGKLTRKETQEIKTRLTWSRKRELKEADGKRD